MGGESDTKYWRYLLFLFFIFVFVLSVASPPGGHDSDTTTAAVDGVRKRRHSLPLLRLDFFLATSCSSRAASPLRAFPISLVVCMVSFS